MTSNQVKYIVKDLLGESMDTWTYLPNVKCINLSKQEKKICDKRFHRFYFNSAHDLLECKYVKEFSRNGEIPASGAYDIILDSDGTEVIYQILTDDDGNQLIDTYTFESILLFEIKE